MYAQLGDIIFEGLFGPSSFERETETEYAIVKVLNSKPDLQATGLALDIITLQINLHHSFCDVGVSYAKMEDARINKDIMPYVDGYGNLMGDYVIHKIKQTVLHTDTKGYATHCECEVTLMEYVDPNRKLSKKLQAKRDAFALSTVAPPSFKIQTVAPSTSIDIFKSVKDVSNTANQATNAVKVATENPAKAQVYLQKALNGVGKVAESADQLVSKLQSAQAELQITQAFINQAGSVKNAATNLANSIGTGNIGNISGSASVLTSSVGALNTLSLPVQKNLILR